MQLRARIRSCDDRISLSDRILGTGILIAVAASLIGTRAIPVLLPLLSILFLQFAVAERKPLQPYLWPTPVAAAFGLLIVYALASTSWALAPLHSIPNVLTATLN